ncbi:hypothetical protein N658DRAFT_507350 [Parathielavia hyrcaniae]|uniref:Uncharacterized protein n=1 Tax=Parathielavia hyrcaniae TaxID=113614 RepID=A0AAN6T0X4_9PEZI|nr:hypothetical protein N658DRAFT_507350 [Parathielavia hyrcaniae]
MALPNKTKLGGGLHHLDVHHQRHAGQPGDAAPIITFKTTTTTPISNNAAPNPEDSDPLSRQTDPSHDPAEDPDESSTTTPPSSNRTNNPASANRAIAGMGVGLVSVMLIFTVFL